MCIRIFFLCAGFLIYSVSASATEGGRRELFQMDDKICSINFDPSEGSLQRFFEAITGFMLPSYLNRYDTRPYNGFKFLRTYTFKPTSLDAENHLKVAFCGQGKVQWQASVVLQNDLDWNQPFCIYGPGDEGSTGVGHPGFWTRVWHKVTSANKPSRTPKEMAKKDLMNFHCFKLARRKKYFNRHSSLFFPGSWVGGIFYCDLDEDTKNMVLESSNDELTSMNHQVLHFCARRNSVPLLPLQSDNYGKGWLKYESSTFATLLGRMKGFQVTKYVPYLYTPNCKTLELNFKKPDNNLAVSVNRDQKILLKDQIKELVFKTTPGPNAQNPWFSEIDVEERYPFSADERVKLGRLTAKTFSLLDGLASAPRSLAAKFITGTESLLPVERAAKRLRKYFSRVEKKVWERLPLQDKALTLMMTDSRRLREAANKWKGLKIEGPKYEYSVY